MGKVFRSQILTKKWKHIEGIPELMRNLEKISDQVEGEQVVEVLLSAAESIRNTAQAKLYMRGPFPYGTGRLASAIFVSRGRDPFKDPKGPTVVTGVSSRRAPHAHFVELGVPARGIPARPFWRPAINIGRELAADMIAQGLKRILAEAGK